MKTVDITDIKKLKQLAFQFANQMAPPYIVLLEGPLGAGKTQTIRFMTEALGVQEKDISSPAFSLINVYTNPKGWDIYHLDLFRLNTPEDLESTGFWDIFANPAIVFIEWADKLQKKELPFDWKKLFLKFQFKNTNQRLLSYTDKLAVTIS